MKNLLKAALIVAVLAMLVFVADVFLPSPPASAQVPQKISYQGFLTNASSVPVSGSMQLAFALYDTSDPAVVTPLWSEIQQVGVNNGVFNVLLGSTTAITLAFDKQYYLGITVGTFGTDPEMTPRQPLASAPYAIKAGCNPGDRVTCYTGSAGTDVTGKCQTGVRTCNADGTAWSTCVGEVTPNCGANCVNLQTDPANCGTCGTTCASGAPCNAGVCGCPAGQLLCSGACVSSSNTNCGSCGNVCNVAGGQTCGGGGVPNQCGAIGGCSTPSQCPGTDSICGSRTCTAGVCGMTFASSATVCNQPNVHCNGLGTCGP